MNCLVVEDYGTNNFWVLFGFLSFMNFALGLLLVIAAIRIRKVVQQTIFAHPNEKLVIIHAINFSVWQILWMIQALVANANHNNESNQAKMKTTIFETLKAYFEIYMDLFLLYLVSKFA